MKLFYTVNLLITLISCVLAQDTTSTNTIPDTTQNVKPSQQQKKSEPIKFDMNKILEPSPPTTHHCFLLLEYYDHILSKLNYHTITIALFGTAVPKSVYNFEWLSETVKIPLNNQKTINVGYPNNNIDKIIKNKFLLTGDVLFGFGKFSIHGSNWPIENFNIHHDRPGRVSFYNDPENVDPKKELNEDSSNQNSEFIIDLGKDGNAEQNGRSVVFGQVIDGLETLLQIINDIPLDDSNKPTNFKIVNSVIDPLVLGNAYERQEKWENDMIKFNNGDYSVGETLNDTWKKILSKEFIPPTKEQLDKNEKLINQFYYRNQYIFLIIVIIMLAIIFQRHKDDFFINKKSSPLKKF